MHPSKFPEHPAAFREDVSLEETELANGYILGLEQGGILRGAPRVLREELFTNRGVRTVSQRALHAQRPGTTTGPAAVWHRNGHKRVRGAQ